MKVGPKGQVVIPIDIREAQQIYPGTEVIFETTDHGILIGKSETQKDPIEVFREIAFSGKRISAKEINLHGYEEQIDSRFESSLRSRKVRRK